MISSVKRHTVCWLKTLRFRKVLGVVTEALGYRELHQGSWMYQGYCLLALAG